MIRSIVFALLNQFIHLKFPAVKNISTQDLAVWLKSQSSHPVILDARAAAEYAVSHLAEAQLADPISFNPERSLQNVSKKTPLVVYCSVGYRSAELVQILNQSGFTQVFNLEGGLFQWANENQPLFQDGRPAQQVHPYSPLWSRLLRHRQS